jgi:isopenicillin N synthase-like dioxygenase
MGSISEQPQPSDANTVPIVDLSAFTNPSASTSPAARLDTAKALVAACRHVGFVYIKNHGVPQSDLDQAFAISKKFFDLPTEEKMKAPHPEGWAVYRGYSWPGLEKVSNALGEGNAGDEDAVKALREVSDYKESYDMGSDDNPDEANIWLPSGVLDELRPFMTSFYWTCFDTAKHILRALALGIGLPDEDHLLNYHNGHYNELRLLHYPPIPAQAIEGGKFARMPAHTDWSSITMLFQDNCGGLQVESPTKAGTFIDVDPIAGTCLLNVGDLLQRWSNDFLKSTQHRVQLPPLQDRFTGDERLTRARYSIPYFVTTDPDLVIKCLEGRFEGGEKAKYEPITQRAYSAMRASMQY